MTENPGSAVLAEHEFRSLHAGLAFKHGVAAAFVHQQIERWCAYNQAKEIDAVLIDGAHWMYISHERLQAALPWYNVRTIRRAIETLNRAQLLHKRLRKGTDTERSGSPAALLYRATKYVDAGVDKMSRGSGQNVLVGGGQNVHVEYVNSEQEKKSAVLKDQTTSARIRSKEAAVSCEREKSKHTTKSKNYTGSADGPQPIGKAIARAIDGQPSIRKILSYESHDRSGPVRRNLSAEEIRKNEEAQAIRAAADEKRLIPELRNLLSSLLGNQQVPQDFRETIETALQEEYNPFFDRWDHDVLSGWVEQLQNMPKQEEIIETPIGEAAGLPIDAFA